MSNKTSKPSYRAAVEIKFKQDLETVINKALKPEIDDQFSDRSNVYMKQNSNGLQMVFESTDTVALRAAVNSYLRWIQGILSIVKNLNENS